MQVRQAMTNRFPQSRLRDGAMTRSAGFSTSMGEIPHSRVSSTLKCQETPVFHPLAACSGASFLQSYGTEHHLIRATVLSIVLALAVGPNASLLCRTLCDPKAAAMDGCHQEAAATSSSIAADDGCADVSDSAALLREDVRGDGSRDGDLAVPLLRHHFQRSATDARHGQEPGREWSLEKRPHSIALRV